MVRPQLPSFQLRDLELDDQPEVALVLARRAIEARLEWLASYLAPDRHRLGSSESALNVLKSQSGFDTKTVRAIRDVLGATDPVAHGRSVSPSVAAVVAESAERVCAALEDAIQSLQEQLEAAPPRTRLAYAFLALPSTTRRAIAVRLDLFHEGDDALSRKGFARAVFERARAANRLAELWSETAQESKGIPDRPPDGLGAAT
ncbi:MAG: hypothetical protein F4X76_10080 [Chloroflexi bacterium]|nr:hypothetical protein [Chloroflexota bacterium]